MQNNNQLSRLMLKLNEFLQYNPVYHAGIELERWEIELLLAHIPSETPPHSLELKEYATIYDYGYFRNDVWEKPALITRVKNSDWYIHHDGRFIFVAYEDATPAEAIQCAIAKMLSFLNQDWEPGLDKWTFEEN